MPCGKGGHRKHTPITTEKQQGFFGAELARRKEGEKGRAPSITTAELRSHLKESKGKELPVESSHYADGEGRRQRDEFHGRKRK